MQISMRKQVKFIKASWNNQGERVSERYSRINQKDQVLNLNLVILSQEKTGPIIIMKCQWLNLIKSRKLSAKTRISLFQEENIMTKL